MRFEKGHLRPRSSPRALVVRRSRLERGGRDGTGRLYCGEHPADGEWSQHWLCAQWGQTNKGGRQQTWYICSLDYEADNRGRACFHTRQDVLDDAVVGHVLRRVGLSGVTREVADHLEAEGERERAGARRTRALRELLRREIGGLKKKLPWAEARADYDLLMAEIRQRERQVEQLSRPEPRADGLPTAAQVAAVAAFLGALPRAWPGVTHDTRRRFLELLLERVTVYHDGSRELYLHLRWRTGLTDVLRAHRVHPPRPEGWRWDSWEDDAIRAHYPACRHVAEVLSRVKPFRNWSGVKQRASRLGVSRAAERPPEGVAERRRVGYRKTGVERRSHEHVGSYTEAERRAWVAEGCHPSSFRGRGVSNMGGDASSPNRRRNRC